MNTNKFCYDPRLESELVLHMYIQVGSACMISTVVLGSLPKQAWDPGPTGAEGQEDTLTAEITTGGQASTWS